MSVYTTVSAEELDAWLARYALGALKGHEPIKAGIENTNYFVTTERGRYTLVQGLPIDDFSREKMNATLKELEEERAGVASLLG